MMRNTQLFVRNVDRTTPDVGKPSSWDVVAGIHAGGWSQDNDGERAGGVFADLTAAECHRMLAEGGDHVGINRGGSLQKEV